jgi:Protein of unknown function (DUF3515)
VTLPFVVVAAVVIGIVAQRHRSADRAPGAPLPALTASAPPQAQAQAAACTKVLEQLPVTLNGLAPRIVHTAPASPFVVAWGDPAIVLRCGVDRPRGLKPGSDKQLFSAAGAGGAFYDVAAQGSANVYTAVDRSAYVSITVPSRYQGADVLPVLNRAIVTGMPVAVCSTDPTEQNAAKLCTRRR